MLSLLPSFVQFGWHAGVLEAVSLQPCSVDHSTSRGGKKTRTSGGYGAGSIDACSSNVVVAGARVTPMKEIKSQMVMLIQNQLSASQPWQLKASNLAKTLEAKSLCLVGDGECFEVVNKF
jgi:hypothetical protein